MFDTLLIIALLFPGHLAIGRSERGLEISFTPLSFLLGMKLLKAFSPPASKKEEAQPEIF